jgi:hypothetical protein
MGLGVLLATPLGATSSQLAVMPSMVVIGLGLGLSMPVFNVVAQNAVPHRLMSSATSALQFIRQMGAGLGLAVMGSYFNSRLSVHVAQHQGQKVALAGSIHDVFIVSLLLCGLALAAAAFLREVPLRTARHGEQRQEALASAVA